MTPPALVAALGDGQGQVVDLSANRTTSRALRPRARRAGEGLPLDLHPRVFTAGTATVPRKSAAAARRAGRPATRPTGSSRGPPSRSSSAAGSSTPCANMPPRSPDGAERPRPVLRWHRAVLLPHGRPDAGRPPVRRRAQSDGLLEQVGRVRAELFGSLGATGHGHGSDKAVVLGLRARHPRPSTPRRADPRLAEVRATGRLRLAGTTRWPSTRRRRGPAPPQARCPPTPTA